MTDRAPQPFILSLLALSAICFVPSLLFYFLSPTGRVTSGAPGVIAVCLLILGMILIGAIRPLPAYRVGNYATFITILIVAIGVHFVGAIAVGDSPEPGRALLSLVALAILLGGGIAVAALFRQGTASLDTSIAIVRWLLIASAVLAAVGIRPWQGSWEKPIFPFSEPSHLALILNPLLLHACVTSRTGVKRISWAIGSLALAYAIQSVTLAVGVTVSILICLPLTGVVVLGLLGVTVVPWIDLDYFTSRLDFNEDTRNLSSLVYRQGWELLADAMDRTSGWGVGFQQLGYATFRSPSADVLFSILRNDANTRDGGFLLAKIGSEFGILGCLLVLGYLYVAARAVLIVRGVAQGRYPTLPAHVVLACCIVCGFVLDMFVRSVGYFAGSVLLLVSSLYILWEFRSENGFARR